jgi:hypothetical protein
MFWETCWFHDKSGIHHITRCHKFAPNRSPFASLTRGSYSLVAQMTSIIDISSSFPPELERETFEIAAMGHPEMTPTLLLVAQRVRLR